MAENILYVRRLVGIPDDVIDEGVDGIVRTSLEHHYYYDHAAADARRRMKPTR